MDSLLEMALTEMPLPQAIQLVYCLNLFASYSMGRWFLGEDSNVRALDHAYDMSDLGEEVPVYWVNLYDGFLEVGFAPAR